MTTYVVLTEVEAAGQTLWKEIGQQEGSSDLDSIKKFLARSADEHGAGSYRSVPKRSWPKDPHKLEPKITFV